MRFRFLSVFVLVCLWCFSTQAQTTRPEDNFYDELRRNFVPAPSHNAAGGHATGGQQTPVAQWPELTENNANQWGSFASDGALTTLSDNTDKVKVGSASLLFSTKSGADTGVRYPATGAAHFDVTSKTAFVFWAYGYNTNSYGFQGNQPVVVLRCTGGSVRYVPSTQVMSNDSWHFYAVPLAGSSTWVRTDTGTPDLSDVLSVEIHQDTWSDSFSVYYDGVAFRSPGNITGVPEIPPVGVNPDVIAPRILLYCFDPIMENMGGVRQHQTYVFRDPVMLANQVISDLKNSSHGLYQPQIVETQIVDQHPYFADGFQHTDESFKAMWDLPSAQRDFHQTSIFDYARFCRENNIVERVEKGEIDEVWIYAGPINGTWESTMVGKGAYWLNSSPPKIQSNRLFAIMGLNFERGVGEAIHSFGHRCESIMARCYGGWPNNQSTSWSKFTLRDQLAPGLGGVGNVHFPVNGTSDYDWANTNSVPSNADDWANYPAFQNATRTFSSSEWTPARVDPQREYLNWWYSHMPHGSGVAPDGFLNNWWRYIADIDQFKDWDGNLTYSQGLPSVSISSPRNGAAVSGIVNISANALVDGALGRVDFYVDGVYQASDTLAPYNFAWDTTGRTGVHRLEARAIELSAGVEAVSQPILVNIGDVPVPTFSVSDVTAFEGNDGDSQFAFTVTRGGDANIAASVSYATSDYTARAGSDYTATSGTLNFEPGQTEQTVIVSVTGDRDLEANEAFFLELSSPVSALLEKAKGVATIQNDDVTASVDDVKVKEGIEAGKAVFTVTLIPSAPVAVDVNYTTSTDNTQPDAATPGDDFTPVSGVLHFAPQQTSATVAVPILDDAQYEHDEQFFLDISGVPTTKARGVGTIENDDALPTLSVKAPVPFLEGNSDTQQVSFSVVLSAPSKIPVAVNYATAPGATHPASAEQDYAPVSGTLNFAPGEVEHTVTVAVSGDNEVEADETFALVLSAPTEAQLDTASATGETTILNDDTQVTVDNASVSEDDKAGNITFTVSLSPVVPFAVDVNYATSSDEVPNAATADSDYTPVSGTLHFVANQKSSTVSVPILPDSLFEGDEVFTLHVSVDDGNGANVSEVQATGTILNDDATPTLTVHSPAPVLEGNTGSHDAVFKLNLSAPSAIPVSVDYATAAGSVNSATPNQDYVPNFGTVTFAPGVVEQSVSVTILGDVEPESNETYSLKWSNPTNASLSNASDEAIILNDDTRATISDVNMVEGNVNSTASLTVTLSPPVPVAVDVTYTANSGEETNAATAGEDYTPVSGTLHFEPNQQSATVTVPILGDTLFENDEVFHVSISAPEGVNVTKAQGTITLRNDDGRPSISLKAPSPTLEGNTGTRSAVFTISLSKSSALPVSVSYATAPGKLNPATANQDYVSVSGTLVFAPGQTSQTVSVPVRGDVVDEDDETFTLSLSNPLGGTLIGTSANATITDDDTAQVSVGTASVTEGNAGNTLLHFPVSMSLASSRSVVVSYMAGTVTTNSARATAGVDYVPATGTLTLAPGQTKATIDVAVIGDTIDEEDEHLGLFIRNVQNATSGTAYVEGVIRDDDALARVNISDITVTETNRAFTATFVVSLANASGRTISLSYATADGTAKQGSDYTTTKGELVFAPGETQKRITIPILGDLVHENTESFVLKLSGLQNAQFTRSSALCNILNDDK